MSRIVRINGTDIKLSQDIPMPVSKKKGRYPWRLMKKGESFLFPKDTKEMSARISASMASKRTGFKFTVRRTEVGLRCWRVE